MNEYPAPQLVRNGPNADRNAKQKQDSIGISREHQLKLPQVYVVCATDWARCFQIQIATSFGVDSTSECDFAFSLELTGSFVELIIYSATRTTCWWGTRFLAAHKLIF